MHGPLNVKYNRPNRIAIIIEHSVFLSVDNEDKASFWNVRTAQTAKCALVMLLLGIQRCLKQL